jgi:hypothetical protein
MGESGILSSATHCLMHEVIGILPISFQQASKLFQTNIFNHRGCRLQHGCTSASAVLAGTLDVLPGKPRVFDRVEHMDGCLVKS